MTIPASCPHYSPYLSFRGPPNLFHQPFPCTTPHLTRFRPPPLHFCRCFLSVSSAAHPWSSPFLRLQFLYSHPPISVSCSLQSKSTLSSIVTAFTPIRYPLNHDIIHYLSTRHYPSQSPSSHRSLLSPFIISFRSSLVLMQLHFLTSFPTFPTSSIFPAVLFLQRSCWQTVNQYCNQRIGGSLIGLGHHLGIKHWMCVETGSRIGIARRQWRRVTLHLEGWKWCGKGEVGRIGVGWWRGFLGGGGELGKERSDGLPASIHKRHNIY